MNELVAALTRLALPFENPVQRTNGAMIQAFVEQCRVNRRRCAVLKSLLMKAGQDRSPFRGIQRSRNKPHGGGRRKNTTATPLPIKRSTRDIERIAGCLHSDNRSQFHDGGAHNSSVSGNGRPNNMATFF